VLQATDRRTAKDVINDMQLEPDMRNVQVVAHILHTLTCHAGPIDGDDHEAVCWLVGELVGMGRRLDKAFDALHEAAHRKAVAS
jgi:hypothetical protein